MQGEFRAGQWGNGNGSAMVSCKGLTPDRGPVHHSALRGIMSSNLDQVIRASLLRGKDVPYGAGYRYLL